MGLSREERDALVEGAKTVLKGNDLGRSTKPAPDLYPHQWNWDSCFISIGLSHVDTDRALEEIRSLLRGQWGNGMVPQIIFNPEASGYFPGPNVWQSERSPDAPRGVQTSGITQPPILATALLEIWRNAQDKTAVESVLRELVPHVFRYHEFFYSERNPDGDGLIVVVHPWESGLDNSPPYLDAGERVHMTYQPKYERLDLLHVGAKNRPTNKNYDLFIYLLEQMRDADWNQQRYLLHAPLQVQDVLFNSILCRANRDLAILARALDLDGTTAETWADMTSAAMNARLWDDADGTYYSFDRVAGHSLRQNTIAAFITLYGGVATAERARLLIERHLLDQSQFRPTGGHAVPTTAMDSPWFDAEKYWLGPVWVNTNWMVADGLERYGHHDLAEALRDTVLKLVSNSGYREYFNPLSGEGYGTSNFSWTASLVLDIIAGMPAL